MLSNTPSIQNEISIELDRVTYELATLENYINQLEPILKGGNGSVESLDKVSTKCRLANQLADVVERLQYFNNRLSTHQI